MQIKYFHKMGNEDKPFMILGKDDIPEKILNILLGNKLFETSTIFGKKGLGDPDEIEILTIIFDDGKEKTFKYYNKGIHYLFHGDESLQPVFQVFTFFMMQERNKLNPK